MWWHCGGMHVCMSGLAIVQHRSHLPSALICVGVQPNKMDMNRWMETHESHQLSIWASSDWGTFSSFILRGTCLSSLSVLWMLFLFCKLNFCCCCYRDYCLYGVAGVINNSIQKTQLTVAKAELKCDFSVVCYISFKLSWRNVKARQATLRQDTHYDEYKCASTQWTTPWGRCLGRTFALSVCVCVLGREVLSKDRMCDLMSSRGMV